jgi:N-acetyl-gamma-glutamyl-phosphate reductase
MAFRIFIDGEAGTTGLQIRERLESRDDLALIQLADHERKDTAARLRAFEEADVAILCLPDEAVREIVPQVAGMNTRLIDASTAHRTDPEWVFGFPEIDPVIRGALTNAKRVSNPGCYASGAIALLRPLIQRGLIADDESLDIFGLSGYTGGGKSLIAEFENGTAPKAFVYATGQVHKHIPEIVTYSGLTRRPAFIPTVGDYAQGMIVQVPLHAKGRFTKADLHAAYADHYAGAGFVTVAPVADITRIDPTVYNGTNRLEILVLGDDTTGTITVASVLDNLGKGASGAAVQNLNIMLGLDESLGL